ncbi:MAG: hypothetical protein H7831_15270 [Magnetococcus sp. WYHC-3]
MFHCPFCDHHKKKLSINLEKNVFKCWVCGRSGKDIGIVVKRFGSQVQFNEWCQLCPSSRKETSDLRELLSGSIIGEIQPKCQLPEGFVSLVNNNCTASLPPRNFLYARGITQENINKHRLGYTINGEYSNRIIVPSVDSHGRVTYFVGRTYINEYVKYKNPPASKDIIFNELEIDFSQPIVLVENVFDAVKFGQNVVPLLGSTLKEDNKLFQVLLNNKQNVYLALDSDAETKEEQISKKLRSYGIEVYKIKIQPYSSIGEMTVEEFEKRKNEATEMNSMHNLKQKWEGIS